MVSLQATAQNHWAGCANRAHLLWTFFGKRISTPVSTGQETKGCGHEPPQKQVCAPLLSICPSGPQPTCNFRGQEPGILHS